MEGHVQDSLWAFPSVPSTVNTHSFSLGHIFPALMIDLKLIFSTFTPNSYTCYLSKILHKMHTYLALEICDAFGSVATSKVLLIVGSSAEASGLYTSQLLQY